MRLVQVAASLLLLIIASSAHAGQKSVTYYLDGARIEEERPALQGYLELRLPDSFAEDSLRVKPSGRGSVTRVELVPAQPDRRQLKEAARLEQRKRELQQRLQSLSEREELFAAAAKSQSSRAPRKSKNNPDPLVSLRQGTDFALGRLETASRNRRSCELSLEAVERRLAAARKGAPLARIWITGNRATVSYVAAKQGWTPSYAFRFGEDGGGELRLHAKLPRPVKGVLYRVSNGTVAQNVAPKAVRGEFPVLSRHPLTLQGEPRPQQRPVSFAFKPIEATLPPGEAAAYWRGEYLGTGTFSGAGATELSIAAPRSPLPLNH